MLITASNIPEEKAVPALIEALAEVEQRKAQLQATHDALLKAYVRQKYDAVENVWRVLPQHCPIFKFLPRMNAKLLESDDIVGQYYLGEKIGEGQNSTVRKCTRIGARSGDLAVKITRKDEILAVEGVLRIERELKALHELSSSGPPKYCVQFVDSFHGRNGLYIVTEAVPIDLVRAPLYAVSVRIFANSFLYSGIHIQFEFISYFRSQLDSNIVALVLREIAAGLAFIHSHRICHGDLKPENILVDLRDSTVIVKLCDFGLCSHFEGISTEVCRDFVGTPGFFPPEAVLETRFWYDLLFYNSWRLILWEPFFRRKVDSGAMCSASDVWLLKCCYLR
jgi:serine/threonine protein kinase